MKKFTFISLTILSLAACKPSTESTKKQTLEHVEKAIAANKKSMESLEKLKDKKGVHSKNLKFEIYRHDAIDGYLQLVLEATEEQAKDIYEEPTEKKREKSTFERASEDFSDKMDARSERLGHSLPSYRQ